MTMNRTLAGTATCILILGGCASAPGNDKAAWNITPINRISHGADAADDWYQKGRSEQYRGRYAMALASYEQVLHRDPHHADAMNGKGVIHGSQGRYEEAIADFEAAVQAAPQRAYLYNNLGYAYLLAERPAQARQAFERALVLEPGHTRAEFNLARLDEQFGGQPPEAGQARNDEANEAVAPAVADAAPVETATLNLVTVAPQIYELRHVVSDGPAVAAVQQVPVADAPRTLATTAPTAAETPARTVARVEISNGNGVRGMARDASHFLRGQGIVTARLTNQKPFNQRATEIRYRSGYREAAERIGNTFSQKVALQESKALRPDIQVRLVLGRDLDSRVAFSGSAPTTLALASLP